MAQRKLCRCGRRIPSDMYAHPECESRDLERQRDPEYGFRFMATRTAMAAGLNMDRQEPVPESVMRALVDIGKARQSNEAHAHRLELRRIYSQLRVLWEVDDYQQELREFDSQWDAGPAQAS